MERKLEEDRRVRSCNNTSCGLQSTLSTPRSDPSTVLRTSTRGMPSTRAQAEGLRVDTERGFLPRFKNRGLAPSNVSKTPQIFSLTASRNSAGDNFPT